MWVTVIFFSERQVAGDGEAVASRPVFAFGGDFRVPVGGQIIPADD